MRYVEELRLLRRSPDVIMASLAANLLGLVLPLVMIQLYDRIIPNKGYETLIVLGVGLVVAILCDAALRLARGYILSRAGARFELLAHTAAIRNLLRNPEVRSDTPPGVLFNDVSLVDRLRSFHTGDTGTALLDLPFVFVFLSVMIAISPILGGTVLTLVAIVFLLVRAARHRITELSNIRLERDGRRQSFLIETLSGIEVIKALGAEDFMERRYERLMAGSASVSARLARRIQGAQAIAGAAGLLAPVVTAGVGAFLVIEQQLTVGALAAAVLLTGRIVQPALRVEMLLAGEDDIRVHEETVQDLLRPPQPSMPPRGLEAVDSISIQRLHVRPGMPESPADQTSTIDLAKGDCLVLRVIDGSAATAALRTVSGQVPPASGRVLLGDVAVAEHATVDLRRAIGLVSGEHRPLSGTILENLTRFEPERYRERALELCSELGIDTYIAEHQAGLSHPLRGEVGGELPTSIEDGLSIISSLVSDPDVILIDEAGTSFDPDVLRALFAYLKRVADERIIVIASNRPEARAMGTHHAVVEDGVLLRDDPRPVLDLGRVARRIS